MRNFISCLALCLVTASASSQITAFMFPFTQCNSNSVDVNAFVTGGIPPYTFIYDMGDGTVDTVLASQSAFWFHTYPTAGAYTISLLVEDFYGSADTLSTLVIVPSYVFSVTETVVPLSSCGQCDASITLSATGGVGPIFYNWSTGSQDTAITNLCAGVYTAYVSDSGCTDSVIVEILDGFGLDLSGVDPTCNAADGSISPIITGGPGVDYTFAWSNGNTDSVQSNLQSGWYTVTVSDTGTCMVVDSFRLIDSCGTIRGIVFDDEDGNGIQDPGEGVLAGVSVKLLPDNIFAISNSNGVYNLTAPGFGTFTIEAINPPLMLTCFGSIQAPGTVSAPPGGTHSATVTQNQPLVDMKDFGIAPPPDPCGIIGGQVILDTNGNGMADPGEMGLPGVTMTADNGFWSVTNLNGEYGIAAYIDSPVTISLSAGSPSYYCGISNPSYSQTFPAAGAGYTITLSAANPDSFGNNFGVTQNNPGFDVAVVSIRPPYGIDAGTSFTAWMDYKSFGTITANCVLRLNFDPLLTLLSSSKTPSATGADFVEWTFTPNTIPNFDCMLMTFSLDSSAVAGTSFAWSASYNCGTPDACSTNDSLTRTNTVVSGPAKRAGFQANALLSLDRQGEAPAFIAADDTVFSYVIQFTNTTGDTAHHLVIIDTLSEHFDVSSMSFPFSSHPYDMSIHGDRVLVFRFADIAISDTSMDGLNSYGFVQFNIEANSGLPDGTEIANQAWISWNYNTAEPTNQTLQKIGFPSSIGPEPGSVALDLYPNPALGLINFEFEAAETDSRLRVVNLLGVEVFSQPLVSGSVKLTLDIDNWATGIYIAEMENAAGRTTRKFVVAAE